MTSTPHDVRPFRVDIPQADLDALHRRLETTRYPAPAPGDDDWSAGTPVAYLREMVEHWRTAFDWRAQEERMNRFPHFLCEIDGQTVHFLHVRSERPDAIPLLLAHSYPGSFADFLDMIGPLTEQGFHVVVPSLPGYPFSTPVASAWTIARVARAWDALMRGLGYTAYGAHGSDAGALVARELAILDPPGFLGAHVLQLFSFPSGDPAEFERMTPADHAALEFAGWFQTVNGYAQMNASRPQTIAAALSDSPVGLLAYNELFENFGHHPTLVTRDQVLTQVSLWWLTNAAATAVRYHYAERDAPTVVNSGPIGVAVFAGDFRSMRPFAERDNTNIVSWTEHPEGGHYAAMEVPGVVVEALQGFFAARRA